MPSKNTIRYYAAPAFYHIYNRGANGQPIFLDNHDREKFLSLLERYLDNRLFLQDGNGKEYPKFDSKIVAYCLMDNHFHLLIFQPIEPEEITLFIRSLSTAYTMYFNKKYRHSGHLFQGVFKASHITDDAYLLHMSRYIHMNPRGYLTYQWSSIRYYLGATAPNWLAPDLVQDISPKKYKEFLQSYEGKKAELAMLKDQLANR